MRKLCRGTPGGQIIGKNLQMKLPPKKEKANIWKYGKSFLCIFTFVNTDFCTFLHSLWCEWICASNAVPPNSLFMLISFQFFADVYILTWKRTFLLPWSIVNTSVPRGTLLSCYLSLFVPQYSSSCSSESVIYIICRNKKFSLGYGYIKCK